MHRRNDVAAAVMTVSYNFSLIYTPSLSLIDVITAPRGDL